MSICRTFVRLSVPAILVLASARTALAQRIEPIAASSGSVPTDVAPRQPAQSEVRKGPLLTWGGVAGGVIGGTAGLFGGFLAGVAFAHTGTCSGEDCSLGDALAGAVVGEMIGLAAGAHVGSARRGNLALAILTSTAIGTAGMLVMRHVEGSAPTVLLAIPVVQLAAVLAIDR